MSSVGKDVGSHIVRPAEGDVCVDRKRAFISEAPTAADALIVPMKYCVVSEETTSNLSALKQQNKL